MATRVLIGIDEAGYGPLLGPLCVGLSAFEVPCEVAPDAATPGSSPAKTPCLWKLLSKGVCREAGRGGKPDRAGRVAVSDSKELKLASGGAVHPLVHLERGVLAFARCAATGEEPAGEARGACDIGTDAALLSLLKAALPDEPWYAGEPLTLPQAHTPSQVAIAGNVVRGALERAGVRVLALRCRMMGEGEFNRVAEAQGGKAATTARALTEHLRWAFQSHGCIDDQGSTRLGIVCDRQGGRVAYAGLLESALPGVRVEVIEESPLRSRYVVERTDAGETRRAGVAFLVEGERAHLPVALASMIAKFTRELAMQRFNRAWCARARATGMPELKPTAGYSTDARRWLQDASALVDDSSRAALVRTC